MSQVVFRLFYAFFKHVVGVEYWVVYQKLDVFGVTLSANERIVCG